MDRAATSGLTLTPIALRTGNPFESSRARETRRRKGSPGRGESGGLASTQLASSDIARLSARFGARYRIERRIGAGASALVYRAIDVSLGRPVALKVLRPELFGTVAQERFLREIGVASRLVHPHIIPVLEAGEAEGLPYFTMPFIDGESLRDRIDREGQLPVADAIRLAKQIAAALSHAHESGVIHRDVKPGNILLLQRDAVLADFGAATIDECVPDARLTTEGLLVGTPHYMSPEQSSPDERVDWRSDLYALGCVLYEMLAGVPPFQGATPSAVLARQAIEAPPSLRCVRPAVPPYLEHVVLRLLAKSAADRFQAAAELMEALSRSESASEMVAREPGALAVWLIPLDRVPG